MVRALKDILKEIDNRERSKPLNFWSGHDADAAGRGDSPYGGEGPGKGTSRDHGEFAQRDYGGDSKRHGLGGRDHAEFAQRTPTPPDPGQDGEDDEEFEDPEAMASLYAQQVRDINRKQANIPGIRDDNKHVDPEWLGLEQQKNAIFQGMTPKERNAMNKDFGEVLGIGAKLIGLVAPFGSPTATIANIAASLLDPKSIANKARETELGKTVEKGFKNTLNPQTGFIDTPGAGALDWQGRARGGIIGLANGGDMGQDDTLGEEDEGNVTASDVEGMQQAYEMTPQEVTSFVDEANLGQGRVDQQFDILDAARRQQGTDKQPVASLEQGIDYLDSIYDPSKSLWGMIPQTKKEAGIGLGKTALAATLGINPIVTGLLGLAYNAYDRSRERESFEESLAEQGIKGSWTNQAPVDFDYTRNYNNPNDMGSDEGYEPLKFTTKVAQEMINPTITNLPSMPVSKGWDLSNLLRVAKSGGPIEAYQGGGITSMMKQMPRPGDVLGPLGPYKPPYSPYPPRSYQSMSWQPPRPPRDHDHKKDLNPDTYFHEHEAGQVRYPNFPTQQPITNTDNPSKKTPVIDDFGHRGRLTIDPPVSPSFTETITQEQVTAEAPPRPEKINIEMPQDVTATLDFPEEIVGTPRYNKGGNVMNYNKGGLTELAYKYPEKYSIGGFLKSILPALAGGAAMFTPLGIANPWIVGGLTGAATGALTGGKKDRTLLGAAKNFLMGGSGASAVGTTAGVGQTAASAGAVKGSLPAYEKVLKAGTFKADPASWANLQQGVQGLMDAGVGKSLQALAGPLAGTVASQSIQPQTPYNLSEIDVARVKTMTPEERQKFFEEQGKKYPSNLAEAGLTFQPPNVDIGFPYPPSYAADGGTVSPNSAVAIREGEGLSSMGLLPQLLQQVIASRKAQGLPLPFNLPNTDQEDQVELEQADTFATASDGGVMEIEEEMESGSFVLPADVVSNIGDGSSTSGHRRLTELFGGEEEYALGGGTGILKGPIKGPGGGLDDLIQTGIDGVRVARLSTDEFVVPKDVVKRIGNGSQKAGAEQLYDFMKNVRLNKHGTSQQPKGINMAGLKKMV